MKKGHFKNIIFTFSVFLFTAGCYSGSELPDNRVLPYWSIAGDRYVELTGLWEFYPGKFYLGDDFNTSGAVHSREYLYYSKDWKSRMFNIFAESAAGYATYRIKITLRADMKDRLQIRIPNSDEALRVYCNNRLIFSNGFAANTAASTTIDRYYPFIAEVRPENGTLEVVVHSSNFNFARGIMVDPIIIGRSETISSLIWNDISIEMILLGCLIIMGIYDLVLFIVMKRNRLYFYFAIVCLAGAVNTSVNGTSLAGRLGLQWELIVMIRYISWTVAVYYYYRFFTIMFKEYRNRFISYFYAASTIAVCAVIAVAPISYYNYVYYPVSFLYLFSVLYFLGVSINEFRNKKENATLLLISFILLFPKFFFAGFINYSITKFNIVSPAEIVLFCVIQSIIMGRKMNAQFMSNDELNTALQRSNAELTVLNKHLELMVAEKTDELKMQNLNLEERVKASIKDLREKDDMLTIKSRQAAMGEMLGFIGHQWKQNIYAISLYTEALKNIISQKGNINIQAAQGSLDKIDSFVVEMFNTFNSFNNFIKPGREDEVFSIKQAVEDTVLLMYDYITINSINLVRDYEGDPEVKGLSNELKQTVINILKNSIDAFNDRSIKDRTIIISVFRRGDMNYLRMSDNAGGIEMDNPMDVFNKFYTSKETGMGLGLYIAKIVIEQRFGGKIEARNTESGAEFTVALPAISEDVINHPPEQQNGQMMR